MTPPPRQTERHLPATTGIDAWDDDRILEVLVAGQSRAIAAVGAATPAIAAAATLLVERLNSGGRLVYAGAGASIRLAVQDGSELPATFGFPEDRILYLIAGGRAAMFDTLAKAEDDEEAARRDGGLCTAGDTVIAIAASGSTPYTLAATRQAKANGATIIAMVNNAGSPLETLSDIAIILDTGPEVIVGSTRLAAGTAQKAALNLLSTLTNIKLGAVHDGYMVNLVAGNGKLRSRAAAIVAAISGVDTEAAHTALTAAEGAIKPAVLLAMGAPAPAAARSILNQTGNNLRSAIALVKRW